MWEQISGTGDELRNSGYDKVIMMVHNSGGMAEVFRTAAIQTFNGGPVAGLIGGANVGKVLGFENIVVSDMGGTSFDLGLVVAGSSDSPVVPNNPLVGMQAAVTRKAESGQELLPEEGVSAGQALALYTVNAACASFEEGIKGSIAPGKLADIVVLSDDPARVPPEEIKDIRVAMTIIGGEVAWES